MKCVSVIGCGNVGANTAFFLAENGTASVTLVDVKPGLSTGKALDLMEAGPLRGYDTVIKGSDSMESIRGSDVVVIAAGRARRPGEHRVDLYLDNAPTVRKICEHIKELAPDAVVVNVVEPVDSITLLAQEVLGFDRHKVLAVGGILSATRIRYLVSNALGLSPREVTALVIGPHRESMVIVKDSIRVSGVPVVKLLGDEKLNAIIEETREAGDKILQMAQRSTAYYAPSAATVGLVEAIVRNRHAVFPVSFRLQGEYGIRDLCVAVPAQIGAGGVERVLNIRLSDDESAALAKGAEELRASIARALRQGQNAQ
jgi:malate dehydrogenase